MKKLFTLLITCGIISLATAQHEADKWFFGTGAALDFSSGSPIVITSPLNTTEGTAAVADANGNLLFFTNGVEVYDSTKTIMPNGSGLTGDISSTQSALIVPSLSSTSQYYIFTTGADGAGDFRYSIVDMNLNGGLGDVVVATKNTFLTDSITEKIAAVYDEGGIWIVTHKWGSNQFYAYHLVLSGLEPPVITNVGTVHNTSAIQNTYGQLKFNNCGTRLACAIGYQDILELFDFDLSTGVVSNPMAINMAEHVYGAEFAAEGRFLYVTSYTSTAKLSQFDSSLPTVPLIAASQIPIGIADDLYGMQLGPDGKIYVSHSFSFPYLGVINIPDTSGYGCNYINTGVNLDPLSMGVNGALSLPGFMQSYLKVATGVSCVITGVAGNKPGVLQPVYPNPSANEFILGSATKNASVIVYDCNGKLIAQYQHVQDGFSFGSDYPKGIYFVIITTREQTKTMKLSKG